MPVNWTDDGVYCGMPVEELEALDAGTFGVEITGDLTPVARGSSTSWSLPATVTGEVPDMSEVDRVMFMTSPLIVWVHEGRVVDLGTGWREGDPEVSQALVEEGAWSGQATAVNSTSCREETVVPDNILGVYDNERPGAHYELRVVTSTSAGHPDRNALLVSDPITVDLDSGVAPLPK